MVRNTWACLSRRKPRKGHPASIRGCHLRQSAVSSLRWLNAFIIPIARHTQLWRPAVTSLRTATEFRCYSALPPHTVRLIIGKIHEEAEPFTLPHEFLLILAEKGIRL